MSITGRLVFDGSTLARFGRRLRSGETGERGLTVSQLQALIEPLPARYVPNPRSDRKHCGAHVATERLLRQVLLVSRRSGMNQSSETAP